MTDRKFLSEFSPRFAVGALAVAITGAMTGAAIGNSGPVDRGIGSDETPLGHVASEISVGAAGLESSPPDHYPLVTPDGTIPVEDLALHGRMRNERGNWWDDGQYYALEASYPDQMSDAEIERLAQWDPPALRTTNVKQASVRVQGAKSSRIEYVSVQPHEPSLKSEPRTISAKSGVTTADSNGSIPAPAGSRPPVIKITSDRAAATLN